MYSKINSRDITVDGSNNSNLVRTKKNKNRFNEMKELLCSCKNRFNMKSNELKAKKREASKNKN